MSDDDRRREEMNLLLVCIRSALDEGRSALYCRHGKDTRSANRDISVLNKLAKLFMNTVRHWYGEAPNVGALNECLPLAERISRELIDERTVRVADAATVLATRGMWVSFAVRVLDYERRHLSSWLSALRHLCVRETSAIALARVYIELKTEAPELSQLVRQRGYAQRDPDALAITILAVIAGSIRALRAAELDRLEYYRALCSMLRSGFVPIGWREGHAYNQTVLYVVSI